MNPSDKLASALAANQPHLQDFHRRVDVISEKIRGWSNRNHYWFFKSWLDAFPKAESVLICGVYLGRDISFLVDAAGDRNKSLSLSITGIDKFNAEPCDDWPQEKRGMTWEEAFNCPPPNMEEAEKNIMGFNKGNVVRLIKANDADWLESATGTYDLIFLDSSHDLATCQRQFKQVRKLCHADTIIAGDDYQNVMPTWGVETAVKEIFRSHQVIDNRIWFAGAEDYL